MRKFLLPVFVVLALGLGLTACGGGSDSSESSGADSTGAATQDESEIEAVIVDSVTRNEAVKCTEDLTQNFVEQSSDATGKAAVEECEEEATDESDDPDEVTVTEIAVEGSKATANVAFVGGPLDGQAVEVALVEDGSGWKLDELVSFAAVDKEALADAFEEQLAEGSGEFTPEQAKCFGDAIRSASDTQLEELVLHGSEEVAAELGEGCE